MDEISGFKSLDTAVQNARKFFRENAQAQRNDSAKAFTLCLHLLNSIIGFKDLEQWPGSRDEDIFRVVAKANEMVLGIAYLSESGLYDLGGSLLRNYSELLLVLIAIGYDEDCYIDWKYERKSISTFEKLKKRIQKSAKIPEHHRKEWLENAVGYWNKASGLFSHQLKSVVVENSMIDGKMRIGVNVANEEWQIRRLNLVTILFLNLCLLLMEIFDYRSVANSRKANFPEAEKLISIFDELYFRYRDLENAS